MNGLEIYIHIPFCVKKCAYCDFLSGPSTLEVREAYVNCLIEEICHCKHAGVGDSDNKWAPCDPENYEVVSAFFGGGTPSILKPDQIRRIMTALKEVFCWNSDAEVTIEANPGTVDEEKLRNYLDCGINRISFGLQSADNEELRKLGRIHTWKEFLDSFHQARIAGFTNINVDLMSALPGQTVDSWRKTLEKVLELKPEHISAYSLIIEEGTPFYEKYEDHPELLPPEDGVISQKTEDLVGPYELHDFFMYYILRYGYRPSRIFRLAETAFAGIYDSAVILKWLKTFYRRFFSQQFKRSCLPDGPKVGSVAVSPRGDLRMPSDAAARIWLEEAESLMAEGSR